MWSNGPMIGFDLETTSPQPLNDARIVSAAIVLDVPGKEQEIFTWISNPECQISLDAVAVHGLSNEFVEKHGKDAKTTILEILDTFEKIHSEYGPIPLVVVNAIFDLTIVLCEIKRLEIGNELNLKFPIIDTLVLDRMLDTFRSGRRTLTSTCANYEIVIIGAHKSDGDTCAAIKLARAIAKKYPFIDEWSFHKLMRMQEISANQHNRHFMEYRRKDDYWSDFEVPLGWPILEGA